MDRRIKISILDDEKAYRQVIKKIVSQDDRISLLGEYAYASDFINSLKSPFKPDVCLMDIKLTGDMTGIECGLIAKKLAPEMHIIFMTGYPDSQTLLRAKEISADYIEKGTIGEFLIDRLITQAREKEQLISIKSSDQVKKNKNSFIDLINSLEESQTRVQSLSEQQRLIMKLKQEGKTISEISVILKIKPNTVSSHLERASKKLALPDPLKYINLDNISEDSDSND